MEEHQASEQEHLVYLNHVLDPSEKSVLLPGWSVAGFALGAVSTIWCARGTVRLLLVLLLLLLLLTMLLLLLTMLLLLLLLTMLLLLLLLLTMLLLLLLLLTMLLLLQGCMSPQKQWNRSSRNITNSRSAS